MLNTEHCRMSDTLAALHAAVIDAPADRTVRLVYADALDESGEPANAARAEFIRAHVELETLPDADPRRPALAARCEELFASHWIDWWRPVCAAVGLPEPYVPKRRRRNAKRPVGDPYIAHPNAWSVRSEEHGFTAQFIAGFPELLYVHTLSGRNLLRPGGDWFAAAPVGRLRFAEPLPELAANVLRRSRPNNVFELTFDRLPLEFAGRLAALPNLRGLTTLKALPLNPAAGVVRELVYHPSWAKLRSLTLTGITPPDAIQAIAERCTLKKLDSLSFGIREVPEVPAFGGLAGARGDVHRGAVAVPGRPPGAARPDPLAGLLARPRSARPVAGPAAPADAAPHRRRAAGGHARRPPPPLRPGARARHPGERVPGYARPRVGRRAECG